ncbi:GspMb/PilO family protein [Sulfuricystis thermophila]|uniref:GspMb/PilO family protein n=1 Tax=Sulfuricystis thermophila TaxID=2496847 RepID=UPI001035C9A0|nr:GspMb/PilO family protein [Sulfuricystis thermophila]
MNPRLAFGLAWRRHPWPVLLVLTALVGLPALTLGGLKRPTAEIVAASDDGGRRSETHYLAFRAILIPRSELEARQHAVIDLALEHGLVPGRIDFGSERDEAGGFDRATLAMPVHGDYADLQKFLAAALAREPALAVAELGLQRDASGNGVQAQLRLVFHLQPAEEVRS